MGDLRDYHKAKLAYLKKLDAHRMPLVSWDFYGDFLHDLSHQLADLNTLVSLKETHHWASEFNFEEELRQDRVIVVTNPSLEIIFASHNMIKMTGYGSDEVLGETPKFFQGEATSKTTNAEIRKALEAREPFEKVLVNYKKSGETYDCLIKGFPVFNKKGVLSHFIAFESVA